MKRGVLRALWIVDSPFRLLLLFVVRLYRLTLGKVVGGGCRFYPTCSAYAEQAIGQWGSFPGLALSTWRVLRCSPLSRGGVDHPPMRRRMYDNVIPSRGAAQ